MWQTHTSHDPTLVAIGMLKSCIAACSDYAARHADAADSAWKVAASNAPRRQEGLNCKPRPP